MTDPVDSLRVVDNSEEGRYELHVGDRVVSTADYRRHDDVVAVPHVETTRQQRGHGMSDRLMRGMLDDLRARGLCIKPLCWVAAAYMRDHPEDADLLAS